MSKQRTAGSVASADTMGEPVPGRASVQYETLHRTPRAPVSRLSRALTGSKTEKVLLWTTSVVVVAAAWEILARVIIRSPLFFPSFSTTIQAGWRLFVTRHSVYGDLLETLREAGIGFAISLAGIPLGLLVGLSRRVMIALEPINSAMYALPHIALVPVAIIWFGLGTASKVFIVFISCFFLIMINVTAGVVTVGRELKDVAQSFSASRMKQFVSVIVPGSVPFIFTAMQLGIGRALVGVVAAELFASNKGFGYLLGVYGNNFETANLFVIIASFAVMGGAASVIVGIIGRRFEKWRLA